MPAADTMVASAAERLERLAERCGLADAAFRSRVGRARSVDALVAAAEGLVTLRVHVNPESRVKLHAVGRVGDLVVGRPRTLLVEIVNEAGVTAPLSVRCLDLADGPGRPATFCRLTLPADAGAMNRLSGAGVEWTVADLVVERPGRWEVRLEADVGQGTQDLGFRATADLLLRGVERP